MKQAPSKHLSDESVRPSGSQTLLRGLDLIDAVAQAPLTLAELAMRLGLSRSTTHRLANALVERRYLLFTPRSGYRLGPKLLDLGSRAQQQVDLVQLARPHVEALAQHSGDTVHLGILSGDRALYLDKVAGGRRVEISSRVGERQPLTTTGLGKALLLDEGEKEWTGRFSVEHGLADGAEWRARMAAYATAGHAFDLEENEDRVRCVAAPIRGVRGTIAGAISVSGAAQYMDDARMAALSDDVRTTAAAISADLGWFGKEEE